jgi:hypothetical protein
MILSFGTIHIFCMVNKDLFGTVFFCTGDGVISPFHLKIQKFIANMTINFDLFFLIGVLYLFFILDLTVHWLHTLQFVCSLLLDFGL